MAIKYIKRKPSCSRAFDFDGTGNSFCFFFFLFGENILGFHLGIPNGDQLKSIKEHVVFVVFFFHFFIDFFFTADLMESNRSSSSACSSFLFFFYDFALKRLRSLNKHGYLRIIRCFYYF